MARDGVSFRWLRSPIDSIGREVRRMKDDLPKNAEDALHDVGSRTLAYARATHPWRNITGAAERGLRVDYGGYVTRFSFTLAHGVFYGIFLELKHGGRWGVIRPAMAYAYTLLPGAMHIALRKTLFG